MVLPSGVIAAPIMPGMRIGLPGLRVTVLTGTRPSRPSGGPKIST